MPKTTTGGPTRGLARDLRRTNFERVMGNAAQMATVLVGIVVLLVAIQAAQVILAPVFLAITVGLMFGPVADAIERRGVPEGISAGLVVILLVAVIIGAGGCSTGRSKSGRTACR